MARWPLGAMVACAALLAGAWGWHAAAQMAREQALIELANTEMQVRQLRAERAVVDELIAGYERERAAGLFDPEDRLLWVAALERVVDSQGVLAATYSLFPQKAATGTPPTRYWEVRHTPMRLQLSLVHELDGLLLLEALRHEVGGSLQVDGCELQRTLPGAAPLPNRGNVSAVCELSWLTLRVAPGTAT